MDLTTDEEGPHGSRTIQRSRVQFGKGNPVRCSRDLSLMSLGGGLVLCPLACLGETGRRYAKKLLPVMFRGPAMEAI